MERDRSENANLFLWTSSSALADTQNFSAYPSTPIAATVTPAPESWHLNPGR